MGCLEEGKNARPGGLVGPRRLKSTLMRLSAANGDRLRITGTGSGHGLGLCQIGANGMAQPPYRRNFREILQHYYPGVEIGAGS